MQATRWGISQKRKAIWFYKSERCSRSMCWAYSEEELKDHLVRKCLTNLEYLEGLIKLKEIHYA